MVAAEPRKYIITVLGGGPGYTLEDQDLWGLATALEHGLRNGYFLDTAVREEWARSMLDRIRRLREVHRGN